jgi:hypothetical protein
MWGQICSGGYCSRIAVVLPYQRLSINVLRVTLFDLLPIIIINSEPRYKTQEDLVMDQRFIRHPLTRSSPMSLNKVFVLVKSDTETSFRIVLRISLVSIVLQMFHKLSINYRQSYTASENNSIVKQHIENTKKKNFTVKLNTLHSEDTGQLNVL